LYLTTENTREKILFGNFAPLRLRNSKTKSKHIWDIEGANGFG